MQAVPAIHFHHVFAEEVNRICGNPQSSPQAIAVELGPRVCAAAAAWMRELGIAGAQSKPFPVMLAMLRKNRMIRPSLKEKALFLQQRTETDLSEMDPELLYHEFGYAGMEVFYLAPVDSIIEAIRCGLELDVPVYGVDLDEIPNYGYLDSAIVIEDPRLHQDGTLADYAGRNAAAASAYRDAEIDGRREFAMAARLKALLSRYPKVLFTGGLAHFTQILRLLDNADIRPSWKIMDPVEPDAEMKRVVVHPVRAVNGQMNPFPAFVKAYEETRKPANTRQPVLLPQTPVDPSILLEQLMAKTAAQYFLNEEPGSTARHRDMEAMKGFRTYLNHLAIVNMIAVPSTHLILKAASEIMSEGFLRTLSQNLMDFPWASPKDFPECGVLLPEEPSHPGRAGIRFNGLDMEKKYISSRSDHFTGHFPIPFPEDLFNQWAEPHSQTPWHSQHSWLPWERLTTSLSYYAASKSGWLQKTGEALESDMNLLENIHIKATLRSHSRGDNRIYVHDQKRGPSKNRPMKEAFPVVWILNSRPPEDPKWLVLVESASFLHKHLDRKPSFNRKIGTGRTEMVAIAGYGSEKPLPLRKGGWISSGRCYCFDALTIYSPLCWTRKQHVQWGEYTQCARNPFLNGWGSYTDEFFKEASRHFGSNELLSARGGLSPSNRLILAALPYAHTEVTVIAPRDLKIDARVFREALRLHKTVRHAPVESFSNLHLRRLATCQLVPIKEYDPSYVYPAEVIEAIGEPPDLYREIVPDFIRDFHYGC